VFRRDYLAGISPYLAPYATANDHALFAPCSTTPTRRSRHDAWQQTVSLVDDMLVKVDRMSMAHSLEVRAPFLDHRLAELMNRVAFNTKLPQGRQKYLLRKAMERYFRGVPLAQEARILRSAQLLVQGQPGRPHPPETAVTGAMGSRVQTRSAGARHRGAQPSHS